MSVLLLAMPRYFHRTTKASAMEETIDELFPATSDDVRAILGEIRRMVQDTLPDATETFYYGALGYGQTPLGFERILYIAPQNGYANLGFFFGAGVSDPAGLLEGSGKRMRHIKIRTTFAAQNPALVPMTREAWSNGVKAYAQLHAARKTRRDDLDDLIEG